MNEYRYSGERFRLIGIAQPPRIGRCCMVHVLLDVYAHIPIACKLSRRLLGPLVESAPWGS
jgi:hypothetical protein